VLALRVVLGVALVLPLAGVVLLLAAAVVTAFLELPVLVPFVVANNLVNSALDNLFKLLAVIFYILTLNIILLQ